MQCELLCLRLEYFMLAKVGWTVEYGQVQLCPEVVIKYDVREAIVVVFFE